MLTIGREGKRHGFETKTQEVLEFETETQEVLSTYT